MKRCASAGDSMSRESYSIASRFSNTYPIIFHDLDFIQRQVYLNNAPPETKRYFNKKERIFLSSLYNYRVHNIIEYINELD